MAKHILPIILLKVASYHDHGASQIIRLDHSPQVSTTPGTTHSLAIDTSGVRITRVPYDHARISFYDFQLLH